MFLNDFWTFKGRNIHAWRVIDSLAWASSIHQHVLWTFSVVLRHETLNAPFFMHYICKIGCQLVCSLTVITHLKQVIVLIKKKGIFHMIILSSHALTTHSTYSAATPPAVPQDTSWDKRRHCRSSPTAPQTSAPAALGPHQLSALPLRLPHPTRESAITLLTAESILEPSTHHRT